MKKNKNQLKEKKRILHYCKYIDEFFARLQWCWSICSLLFHKKSKPIGHYFQMVVKIHLRYYIVLLYLK